MNVPHVRLGIGRVRIEITLSKNAALFFFQFERGFIEPLTIYRKVVNRSNNNSQKYRSTSISTILYM